MTCVLYHPDVNDVLPYYNLVSDKPLPLFVITCNNTMSFICMLYLVIILVKLTKVLFADHFSVCIFALQKLFGHVAIPLGHKCMKRVSDEDNG